MHLDRALLLKSKEPGSVVFQHGDDVSESARTLTQFLELASKVQRSLFSKFAVDDCGGSVSLELEGVGVATTWEEVVEFVRGALTSKHYSVGYVDRQFSKQYEIRAPGVGPLRGLQAVVTVEGDNPKDEALAQGVAALLDARQPVVTAVDLSTAHMPDTDPPFGKHRYAKHLYGYVVFVSDTDESTPLWLVPIIQYALKVGAWLIHFDGAAPKYSFLETWNW